jgi:protein FAM50
MKKRKKVKKSLLSFDEDDSDDSDTSATSAPRSRTPNARPNDEEGESLRPKKAANPSGTGPRLLSRAAQQLEAQEKARLAREFNDMQKRVKKTDIVIPFVFFDGSNTNGGRVRVKKDDQIWLFLDKARRMGAQLSVGGERGRKEWARVNVNDLMLVRGDVILPPVRLKRQQFKRKTMLTGRQHLEFYHFILNKTKGFKGETLFDFSDRPTKGTPETLEEEENKTVDPANYNPLSRGEKKEQAPPTVPDEDLEGFTDDPKTTRVVDSRWYQRNKHIFPASTWVEFDPNKDFSKTLRRDAAGNTFFLG